MKIALVGAGISGITAAYIIKQHDKSIKLDIFEEKKSIGGNCADTFSSHMGYFQLYGPHIFHTNKKYIWNYLNKHSDFNLYQHKVFSYVDGELQQFPFTQQFIQSYDRTILDRLKEDNSRFINAEDYLNYILGKELTTAFFKNYSEKQWGIPFNQLPVDVVRRIPIRETDDTRYFSDKYQGIPKNGFTELLQSICNTHNFNVKFEKVNFNDLSKKYDLIINTSEVDSFFQYKYGELKYRSIIFKKDLQQKHQKRAVINYPNDYDFTRITEYNYFLPSSCYSLEYPVAQNTINSVKCYPIFWDTESQINFKKYEQYAEQNNVILLGRMGLYQYLNMDAAIDVVFNKLTQFSSIKLIEELENDTVV